MQERRADHDKLPKAKESARLGKLGVGIACLALAGGCAARASRPAEGVPPAAEARPTALFAEARADIERALAERRRGVTALRGRGTLLVSSPDWDGATRVQAVVLARRPADLRIRGYTPVSTAFDCLTGTSDFVLHLPDPGEAWTGPAEELGPATGLPLVPADLVSALFGDPFETGDSLRVRRVEHDFIDADWQLLDGSHVDARFHRGPTRPHRFRLVRGDTVRVELEYGDYLLEPAGWWPRRYDLSWPADSSYFRLQLVAVELNPSFEPGSFTLEPPDGTQWIRVRTAGTQIGTGRRP